jgi:hypothetical protein
VVVVHHNVHDAPSRPCLSVHSFVDRPRCVAAQRCSLLCVRCCSLTALLAPFCLNLDLSAVFDVQSCHCHAWILSAELQAESVRSQAQEPGYTAVSADVWVVTTLFVFPGMSAKRTISPEAV